MDLQHEEHFLNNKYMKNILPDITTSCKELWAPKLIDDDKVGFIHVYKTSYTNPPSLIH
jgi:hypothetical protein